MAICISIGAYIIITNNNDKGEQETSKEPTSEMKAAIEGFVDNMADQDDMSNFLKDNINYKAWYVVLYNNDGLSKKEFKNKYSAVDEADYEDEFYEYIDMMNNYWFESLRNSSKLRLKEIGQIEKYNDYFVDVPFTITYIDEENEKHEENLTALFYDNKLFEVISELLETNY